MNIQEILEKHKQWIDNENGGEKADLSEANLSGADLSEANLSWADLSMALGDKFVVFQAGKHQAIFAGGKGFIGCESHSYAEWLASYAEIGAENGYTEAEIERYGAFVRLAVEYLQSIEPTEA